MKPEQLNNVKYILFRLDYIIDNVKILADNVGIKYDQYFGKRFMAEIFDSYIVDERLIAIDDINISINPSELVRALKRYKTQVIRKTGRQLASELNKFSRYISKGNLLMDKLNVSKDVASDTQVNIIYWNEYNKIILSLEKMVEELGL